MCLYGHDVWTAIIRLPVCPELGSIRAQPLLWLSGCCVCGVHHHECACMAFCVGRPLCSLVCWSSCGETCWKHCKISRGEVAFTTEFIQVHPARVKGKESGNLLENAAHPANGLCITSIDMNSVWK